MTVAAEGDIVEPLFETSQELVGAVARAAIRVQGIRFWELTETMMTSETKTLVDLAEELSHHVSEIHRVRGPAFSRIISILEARLDRGE